MTTLLNFGQSLPLQSVPAGEVLLREGERTGLLFILIDGHVEILKGEVQVEVVTEPGALFGEISALLDTPHMATVKTITPARVARIENASAVLQRHPELALEVARLLALRLTNVVGYLADLKRQFEGHSHLGMVDEVLGTLINQQCQLFEPGSNREPDPAL
jgi:CRP/FNR family transcriptional regulator, cyclic AMP receptor protein